MCSVYIYMSVYVYIYINHTYILYQSNILFISFSFFLFFHCRHRRTCSSWWPGAKQLVTIHAIHVRFTTWLGKKLACQPQSKGLVRVVQMCLAWSRTGSNRLVEPFCESLREKKRLFARIAALWFHNCRLENEDAASFPLHVMSVSTYPLKVMWSGVKWLRTYPIGSGFDMAVINMTWNIFTSYGR